jgi:two-component system, chemotaxis family, chemotaxis protein CheY
MDSSPARLMVVDDTLFMRRMLRDLLTRGGYEVIAEARNGREALEYYQQSHPDLVIMDITMPEMDGIQAVGAIRKVDPQARIVMCSALGQDGPVMEALQAGAQDFVLKPFVPEKVLEAVEKVLRYTRADQQAQTNPQGREAAR